MNRYQYRMEREERERAEYGTTVRELLMSTSFENASQALYRTMSNLDFLIWEWLGYGWEIYLETQGLPVKASDRKPKDGLARMSHSQLSTITGATTGEITKSLKRLQERGFITLIEPSRGPHPTAYAVHHAVPRIDWGLHER